ncbi:MAG: RecQ family ATP-dependent DNA helicase [Methanomassiliicoccales archaeon]|nr:MAG: RecQ family ATP-dependent DNA helicase [Methanomassiliicoccales archaeon]
MDEERAFLAAVLSKIYQRGSPSPCSLETERRLLMRCQELSILKFEESNRSGSIVFDVTGSVEGLSSMLESCFFPELLVEGKDLDGLIELYLSICTGPEKEFFNKICSALPLKNLALMIVPQRTFRSMGIDGHVSERVDFAIEVPDLDRGGWLKIVIEIDDSSHNSTQFKDKQRDKDLSNAKWKVYRLRTNEKHKWDRAVENIAIDLITAVTPNIIEASVRLNKMEEKRRNAIRDMVLVPMAESKIAFLASRGLVRNVGQGIIVKSPRNLDLEPAVRSVMDTIRHIISLYNLNVHFKVKLGPEGTVDYYACPHPSMWSSVDPGERLCPIVVSPEVVERMIVADPVPLYYKGFEETVDRSLRFFLQNIFRKYDFRYGQLEIIRRALSLEHVVGLLPTSGGKSLCYQLSSILQPGISVVIDPLRSLIVDQVDNLNRMGMDRIGVIISRGRKNISEESALREKVMDNMMGGMYQFIFIAPERLQIQKFSKLIMEQIEIPITYCVVDEAHCVSEWGHDFRTSYLNVGRRFAERDIDRPNWRTHFIALTGTASRNVLVDIMRELMIEDEEAIVEPRSYDRPELHFSVVKVSKEERIGTIVRLVSRIVEKNFYESRKVPSGLIFTNFAGSEIGVIPLKNAIRSELSGVKVDCYAGKNPENRDNNETMKCDWEDQKINVQSDFKNGAVDILTCTHSFGMGIDKPDIRFTINAMLPRSIEEFYQQAGRAGRDGNDSDCYLVFSDDEPGLSDQILDDNRTPLDDISFRVNNLDWERRDDALHNTWFLSAAFQGVEEEKQQLRYLLRREIELVLKDESKLRVTSIPFLLSRKDPFNGKDETVLEKIIYRLQTIGAIRDYYKDYNGQKFTLHLIEFDSSSIYEQTRKHLGRYISEGEIEKRLGRASRSDPYEAVEHCGGVLIDFIYDKIVKRRRRAMHQMLELARVGTVDIDRFKLDMLAFLEESEFTKPVAGLSLSDDPDAWLEILERLDGVDSMRKLLGACRRQLEETPGHPGLLIMAGFCALSYSNVANGMKDLKNGLFALKDSVSDDHTIMKTVERFFEISERVQPSKREYILEALLELGMPDVDRFVYKRSGQFGYAHLTSLVKITSELGIGRE